MQVMFAMAISDGLILITTGVYGFLVMIRVWSLVPDWWVLLVVHHNHRIRLNALLANIQMIGMHGSECFVLFIY